MSLTDNTYLKYFREIILKKSEKGKIFFQLSEGEQRSFVDFLERNKVLLRFYDSFGFDGFHSDESGEGYKYLIGRVKNEKHRQKNLLRAMSEVLSVFNKFGVKYVVIKTIDGYPDVGKDIDIVILNKFKDAMSMMPKIGFRPLRLPSMRVKCRKFFKTFDGDYVTVDLYDKQYTLIGEDLIIDLVLHPKENMIINCLTIPVFTPEVSFLIKLKEIYLNGQLSLGDLLTFVDLIKRNTFDWNCVLNVTKISGTTLGLYYLLLLIKQNIKQKNIQTDIINSSDINNWIRKMLMHFSQPQVFPVRFAPAVLILLWLNKILFELRRRKIINSLRCFLFMAYLMYKNIRMK
jgi:hypothetical protein